MKPRIGMITLGVRDLAASVKFYQEGLGFPRITLSHNVASEEIDPTYSHQQIIREMRNPATSIKFHEEGWKTNTPVAATPHRWAQVPSTLSIQEIIMEAARSVEILKSLANGIDPGNGKPFAADSAYQHPDTVRALFFAIRALEQHAPQAALQKTPAPDKPRSEKPGKPAPGKAGQPWSEEEDARLGKAYDSGQSIEDLAQTHQRSRWAIEARLARLGKIPAPPPRFPARKSAGNTGTNEMRSQ